MIFPKDVQSDSPGILAPDGYILVCKIYRDLLMCIATCGARIYYVSRSANMTRACLHLGLYKHLVKVGEDQKIKEKTRKLIEKQVKRTPKATNSTIIMEASKKLVDELLIDPKGCQLKNTIWRS